MTTTLVLPVRVTHEDAAACARMLAQAVRAQAAPDAVADASALEQFDSSALAVLLECRREALALGKRFAVRGLPQRLRALAALYGVEALLPQTV
ncbi:STAS domain-containing protein [Ramlibacter sp. AN1015]|uniref:STAS domain-containing protein n=1 Tax=Ramlibacter sp. AN1015 TaxID=3133428 RepID=UPI0030C32D1B